MPRIGRGSCAPWEKPAARRNGEYLKPPEARPHWLRVDRLLRERGIPKDSAAGRREFGRQMERRRQEEGTSDYRIIQRDWCLGSEEFRRELLAAASERVGAHWRVGCGRKRR